MINVSANQLQMKYPDEIRAIWPNIPPTRNVRRSCRCSTWPRGFSVTFTKQSLIDIGEICRHLSYGCSLAGRFFTPCIMSTGWEVSHPGVQ